MQAADPLPNNQVVSVKSQDKKEPSGFESLSPEYKKLWNLIIEEHPWVDRSKTSI